MLSYKYAQRYVHLRDGIFYYKRRIPADLKHHYKCDWVRVSLRTKRAVSANRLVASLNQRLEDYWLGLRLEQMDVPVGPLRVVSNRPGEGSPTILEACDLYLRLKNSADKTFIRTAQRNSAYVANALGNRPITSYASNEAAQFRDWCFKKGMSQSTVKRVFASIRSIINLTMREYGIEGSNAFRGTFMPDQGDTQKRKTIPNSVIWSIQRTCREQDDELRWIISLISDTGMRLSEALGLCKDDVHLEAAKPYMDIRTHSWRRLKTPSSNRKIPLVGEALWAAQQAYQASQSNNLFPRYCDGKQVKANSASAALNKWMKCQTNDDYVIHGFRHSLRDRLRAVQCPSDAIDQLGGWSTAGIGQSYGDGYDVNSLHDWMVRILPNKIC